MAIQQLAAVLALVGSCLLWVPEACGQFQRNNQQGVINGQQGGGQNTSTFGAGRQGRSAFGGSQQGGAFGGGQQGLQGGSQFGQGQQQGLQGANANQGGFVGGDAQDMRSAFENMRGRERRQVMFDMMVENLNEMRDRRSERDARRRQPDLVRVQIRAPSNLPLLDSQQVAVTLQANLIRSLELQGLAAPRVELEGRTATLSGPVASDHERTVIEKMIALQPGVSQVENLLTVEPTAENRESSSEETTAAESPSAQ